MPQNSTETENAIQLYSHEVREIIDARSGWIIRNGIYCFFIIMALMITSSFFIRYPDIIIAPVRIVGINTPKLLTAHADGRLLQLFVTNDQMVDSNQVLAVIESTTHVEEALQLEQWIARIEKEVLKDNLEIIQQYPVPILTELGQLQPAYQGFRKAYTETLESFNNGYYHIKKQALLKDLLLISAMNQSINRQKKILEQEDSLQRIEYKANESLAKEKVVAPLELNIKKGQLLNREQSLEQLTATVLNNVSLDLNKKKEILELQKSISDVKQAFQSSLMTMKSSLEAWKTQYIVTAPERGKVQLVSFMQVNQLIKNGQELLYIIPEQPSYFAEVAAPQQNFGKVKVQQQVVINLSSYPNNEFGSIKGIIEYIPGVPYKDSTFLIRVQLPNGLTTTHHTTLSFKNNLSGEAKIITEERTLANQFLTGFVEL